MVRAAVTSRDGILVNERFHRSIDFFVFEVDGEQVQFVERRRLPSPDGRVLRDFDAVASLLRDCSIIVSLMFNGAARAALSGKGFALREGRGEISGLLLDPLPRCPKTSESKEPKSLS